MYIPHEFEKNLINAEKVREILSCFGSLSISKRFELIVTSQPYSLFDSEFCETNVS